MYVHTQPHVYVYSPAPTPSPSHIPYQYKKVQHMQVYIYPYFDPIFFIISSPLKFWYIDILLIGKFRTILLFLCLLVRLDIWHLTCY